MAQKLNIILITSPELSDFRKRLKNLESRVSAIHDLFECFIDWNAGRPSFVYDTLSLMVSQCCVSVRALLARAGVRTRV